MAKTKKGFRIDIVLPCGGKLYVKTVTKLNKPRDVEFYRSQLHYGYAVRVTSRMTGKFMDMQCFRPKNPDNAIGAANCTSVFHERETKRMLSFAKAVKTQRKGGKRKSSVPAVLPKKKPGILERLRRWLKLSASSVAIEIAFAKEDLMKLFNSISFALKRSLDKQAVSPIEVTEVTAPADVIDLPVTEYSEVSEGKAMIEGEHIPGLPHVRWPQLTEAHREAGSLLN